MPVDVVNNVHLAWRTKPDNCRVEMRVQMADADGAVLSGVNLNEAIGLHRETDLRFYLGKNQRQADLGKALGKTQGGLPSSKNLG